MSIDSNYTNRLDITLKQNRSLQGTFSHQNHTPLSRHSLKAATRERHQQERSKSRNRTSSVSGETPTSPISPTSPTVTELTSPSSKNDRRFSELKRSVDPHEQTFVDRRNSTPQSHLGSFFSHAFFNPKHHHKTHAKEEVNPNQVISAYTNASTVTSPNQSRDSMTAKTDTPVGSKAPSNGTRIIPSASTDRLPSSPGEDSMGSTTFQLEENSSDPRSAEKIFVEPHTPVCIAEVYRDLFYDNFHTNYYGVFEQEGPFLASLRCSTQKTGLGEVCEARLIVRTQSYNYNLSEIVNANNEKNILQTLLNKVNFSAVQSYGTVGDPKANERLYHFDKNNDERFNCKIGMVYQQQSQTSEYEIFSNDQLSNEMSNFLQSLADRIRLKAFPKYRGDLDTREDLHGESSYHVVYDNHEIMFNIAPLIPSTKANGQCIERKGLVGNAFVCIVFQESGATFSPDFISGKVTQIYITVQPVTEKNELYYRVSVWRRNDITSVVDPPGGLYKNDKFFPSYFLTLLLNSVHTAIESPSLRTRIARPRQQMKLEEIRKLSDFFALGPLPEYTLEGDGHSSEPRPFVRSDSTSTSATVTTTETVNLNVTGRTSPSSSKKRAFSKLFNVFSSRSPSISSASGANNDSTPSTPQPPATTAEVIPSQGRASISSIKDSRARSIKSTQAPIPPSRPMNSHVPQAINVHPPAPSALTLHPGSSEKTRHVSTISEEDHKADDSETTETEDEEEEETSSASSSASSENARSAVARSSKYS